MGEYAVQDAYSDFAAFYDDLMRDVDYDAWARSLDRLLHRFSDEKGTKRIMDCACGTGAITIRLARMGYDVIGSDLSMDMLRIAQRKAMENGCRIPFTNQDMRTFSAHRPLDAVTACCDGINYLTDLTDVRRFFEAANRALRPGGLLLFDLSTPYKLENVLGENTFGEDTRACTYLWQNVFDPESRLLEMKLAFFVPDGNRYRRFDETHIQRAHTAEELNYLLNETGFTVLGVYEAFTETDAGAVSERNQWIVRKI